MIGFRAVCFRFFSSDPLALPSNGDFKMKITCSTDFDQLFETWSNINRSEASELQLRLPRPGTE